MSAKEIVDQLPTLVRVSTLVAVSAFDVCRCTRSRAKALIATWGAAHSLRTVSNRANVLVEVILIYPEVGMAVENLVTIIALDSGIVIRVSVSLVI